MRLLALCTLSLAAFAAPAWPASGYNIAAASVRVDPALAAAVADPRVTQDRARDHVAQARRDARLSSRSRPI